MNTDNDHEPAEKRKKIEDPGVSIVNRKLLRSFKKIPIFVVDYHNDVLEFIYRCFGSRHLPLYNNIMIHFDSHPDMVLPREIDLKHIFDKTHLLENLSIENWIMPTCYAGHFNKLMWIKNSWSKQIGCGKYFFNIGDYNDELNVDLKIPYFVSEGNYSSTENLNNKREIHLNVVEIECEDKQGKIKKKSNPETSMESLQKISLQNNENIYENMNKFIENENFILDIDLDYFSTKNPFLNIYDKVDCYKRLTEIFDYEINSNNFQKDYELRQQQLVNLKTLFQYLDEYREIDDINEIIINNNISTIQKIIELIKIMKENYNDNEIDWILIYNAGCTSDNSGLPHYESSNEQLKLYFKSFENFLFNIKSNPIAITIARSSEDGYCPEDKVDFIQENVLNILKKIYGDSLNCNSILWYQDQNWDIMKL